MSRPMTDAERIAGLREVIRAANGDWHDVSALWSVQADLDWLLARAEQALVPEWPAVDCPYVGLHDHRVDGGYVGPWEGPHTRLGCAVCGTTTGESEVDRHAWLHA